MDNSAFYMVFLEGGRNPTYMHSSHGIAVTEARRLASEFGRPAYVLQAISKVEVTRTTTTTPLVVILPDEAYTS